ncbi:Rieske (2Fe-2S) protein [Actinosynnema sp. NPDC023587]|uniref:Rieske (2Fe-2S) protein n=1 Tax=Actinosynnema sp. NPDC023587 TaxID=3154695 RepID=UPI0033F1D95A
MSATENPALSRRSVLCGVLVALAVPGGLAACGDAGTPAGTPADTSAGTPAGSGSPSGGPTPTGGAAAGVVALSEVPDGGGVVVQTPDKPLVITRSGNTVKAFDATCPHAGTTVRAPADGVITCPSHGSTFTASDGARTGGPATTGLKTVDVRVEGDQVVVLP